MNNLTQEAFVKIAYVVFSGMQWKGKRSKIKEDSEAMGKLLYSIVVAINTKPREALLWDRANIVHTAINFGKYENDAETVQLILTIIELLIQNEYLSSTTVREGTKTHVMLSKGEKWNKLEQDEEKPLRLFRTTGYQEDIRVMGEASMSAACADVIRSLSAVKFQFAPEIIEAMRANLSHYEGEVLEAKAKYKEKAKEATPQAKQALKRGVAKAKAKVTEINNTIAKYETMRDEVFMMDKFLDSRGRTYSIGEAVSDQGSDRQKGAILPVKGYKLDRRHAKYFQKIIMDFADCDLTHDMMVRIGRDPVNQFNPSWEKPFLCLNACVEYAKWVDSGYEYEVRQYTALDGRSSGLQFLTLLAQASDVASRIGMTPMPAADGRDLYTEVGHGWDKLLTVSERELMEVYATTQGKSMMDEKFVRKIGKSVCMVVSYSKKRGAVGKDFCEMFDEEGIVADPKAVYAIGVKLYDAAYNVIPNLYKVMEWLQACAKMIIADGETTIRWNMLDGFNASQTYVKRKVFRSSISVNSKKVDFKHEVDELGLDGRKVVDTNRHNNGISPNYIHAHDSLLLRLVAAAMKIKSIPFVSVHDQYEVPMCYHEELYAAIIDETIGAYSDCQLTKQKQEWEERYNVELPPVPVKGDWSVETLRQCPEFFN